MVGIKKQKPIICKRCGKKVGYVRIKTYFNVRLIIQITIITFIVQFITEILANYGASFLKWEWCC